MMKRIVAILGLIVLFAVPVVALAQYDYPSGGGSNYPSGGPSMGNPPPSGGISVGGANSGGGITVGDVPAPNMPVMGGPMGEAGSDSVTIVDFAFQPAMLAVPVGTTVTWNNTGVTHTVTSNDGAFDSGNIGSGGSFNTTFSNAGLFRYHCQIHPNMTGTIMVTGS